MDRELFASRLRAAAARARDYAMEFVEEPLPEEVRFRVRLNSSYDGHPRVGDEVTFPEDATFERATELSETAFDHAMDALWREGRIPEWINVSVVGETGDATLLELVCCGRFTASDELLYHQLLGRPPFHVLGPALPYDHVEGRRFSVYERSECWTLAHLARVAAHAPRVWSLDLRGPAFDDSVLAALTEFPNLSILDLGGVTLGGNGLSGLSRLPALRVLRVRTAAATLHLDALPWLEHLEVLQVEPGDDVAGLWRITEAAPTLTELSVRVQRSSGLAEGRLALPALRELDLSLPDLPASFEVYAPSLRGLYLKGPGVADADVLRLATPHERLTHLGLRGTAVDDGLLYELSRWPGLVWLDLADTRVSEAALRRLQEGNPALKVFPWLLPQRRRR